MSLHEEGRSEDAAGSRGGCARVAPLVALTVTLLAGLIAADASADGDGLASASAAVATPFGALPSSLMAGARPPAGPASGSLSAVAVERGEVRQLAACRSLFFVVTHEAGYAPPEDGQALRALLRGFYLGLEPEWPDGLRAYPLARPADHPASRMIEREVIAAAPAEIAHHWQVMAQRFGQTPPPVVESPRLILELVARRPGVVAILAGDELPPLAHWPRQVVIAATLGAPAARAQCPLAQRRLASVRHEGPQSTDATGLLAAAGGRASSDGRDRAGGLGPSFVPGYRVP
ncbi:MAG: hypothetical protein KatS3mg119_0744 [Rhodothalassiaceae bacterium]|nr:MAG: hypothetical protein KatS3mg119_0744 [Rhodothalassiaceae bacterium]